jgi:uncharacterized membrane-anchored protein
MKTSPVVWMLFAVVCVLQLAVPAAMIQRREAALRHGEVYLFRTAPVDPHDAFRGRYVALDFQQAVVEGIWPDEACRPGRVAYAILTKYVEGFASITAVVFTPPDDTVFLKVRIIHYYNNRLRLALPFDRFYMDEFSAPEAEREYFRIHRERRELPAWARVRVDNGFAVLEDLLIDGQPIRDWLLNPED